MLIKILKYNWKDIKGRKRVKFTTKPNVDKFLIYNGRLFQTLLNWNVSVAMKSGYYDPIIRFRGAYFHRDNP